MRVSVLLCMSAGVLTACAGAPRLDLPPLPVAEEARLQPLDPLLARADALAGDDGPDPSAALEARAAALRDRAARLRGLPVIPAATRTRMQAGAAHGALQGALP